MVNCNTSVDSKMCRYNRNNTGIVKDNIDIVVTSYSIRRNL